MSKVIVWKGSILENLTRDELVEAITWAMGEIDRQRTEILRLREEKDWWVRRKETND